MKTGRVFIFLRQKMTLLVYLLVEVPFMDYLKLMDEAAPATSNNRMIIILAIGIVVLAAIAIWQVVVNRKLEKKLKEREENEDKS